MNRERLDERIEREEGFRARMYEDAFGVPTIGIGHSLRIPMAEEALRLQFGVDVDRAISDAQSLFANFDALSDLRQEVLVSMAFELGRPGLAALEALRAAIEREDWSAAALEVVDSRAARQDRRRYMKYALDLERGDHGEGPKAQT